MNKFLFRTMPNFSKFWQTYGIVAGFVGASVVFLYPTFVYPMTHIDEYRKMQEYNRKDINQEEVQPGGMKVWSDPFGRK